MAVHHSSGGSVLFSRQLVSAIADSSPLRESLQWLTREKQWVTDMHLQLCRIPAPTFLEQQRAEWMVQQFRALGCDTHMDAAGNVVAWLEPRTADRPLIAITAHLDTVFAPRLKDDIVIDPDGCLRGPGVCDNGAGLAALLALARAFKTNGMPAERAADLVLIANVGEEGEGNLAGIRYLCRDSPLAARIGAYLVVDGAAVDHVTVRALGSRRFDLTFTGSGGHSWSDYGIGNPIHALARAVSLFTDTRVNGNPRASFNVGVMEGGIAVNSIASQARAKIDIRSESNEKMEELGAALHDAVERAQEIENQRASAGKVAARLIETGSRPAAQLSDQSPILSFVRAVDAHLGVRARLECSSTDANLPLSLNIPALSIGAGGQGGGAHTPHEWYNPEGRDLGLKRILLTAALLMRFGAA
jgi:acetylornithine deacetylase/succinyl-diaminopimelate desuccinylase-like protein